MNTEVVSTGVLVRSPKSSRLEFRPLIVVLVSILAGGMLATAGSLSDICMGDENPHIRHVRAYAQTGGRVPYDSLFPPGRQKVVPFSGTPLWHAGLAVLWTVAGTESQTLAQFYHAGFYVLLVLSVYFLARRIWGLSEASWAWLIVATMPMVCAYSIVLYQDVPGIAVSALAMLLLWRRNFLWCGIVMAAAYFTKMNMLSLAPWAVVFAAWWAGPTWKRRLASAAMVAVPVAVVFGCDLAWRFSVYGNMMGQVVMRMPDVPAIASSAIVSLPANYVLWKPQTIIQPRDLVSQLGVGLLIGAVLALFRAWDVRSRWLWACFLMATAGFVLVFVPTGCTQVRYAFPAVLVLVLLGAKALARWRFPVWLKVFIITGLVLQVVVSAGYICRMRHISEWDKAGYAWIRQNTPKEARVMFPEQVLTNQTGRPFMWEVLNMAYFMSDATDEQRVAILEYFRVTYIAVPLRRTYDRQKEGDHAGGYARDFVEKLHTRPYLKKVYENPGFVVFEFVSVPAESGFLY